MRGSRKFCQRGSNLDHVFFSLMGEELSKYHYQRAIFGPPANRHSNGVSLAYRLWPRIESWLGSFTILRGSGPVLLKKTIFLCFSRGSGPPAPPPLWIRLCITSSWLFQCQSICLTPSQVDILVSDDSLAFCPTMYNRVFTWVETRAKSEFRVKHVEC